MHLDYNRGLKIIIQQEHAHSHLSANSVMIRRLGFGASCITTTPTLPFQFTDFGIYVWRRRRRRRRKTENTTETVLSMNARPVTSPCIHVVFWLTLESVASSSTAMEFILTCAHSDASSLNRPKTVGKSNALSRLVQTYYAKNCTCIFISANPNLLHMPSCLLFEFALLA